MISTLIYPIIPYLSLSNCTHSTSRLQAERGRGAPPTQWWGHRPSPSTNVRGHPGLGCLLACSGCPAAKSACQCLLEHLSLVVSSIHRRMRTVVQKSELAW